MPNWSTIIGLAAMLLACSSMAMVCPLDMSWIQCGTACPKTCGNPAPDFCTAECIEGCFCSNPAKPILLRDGITCGTIDDCATPSCPGDTLWTACGSSCQPTCNNTNPVCKEECVPGCFCPLEKPISLGDGKCGTTRDCAEMCPKNQVWKECMECVGTCDIPNPICTAECTAGCTCPHEKPILLDDGTCATQQECLHPVGRTPCSALKNKKNCKANGCNWASRRKRCVA